MLLPRLMLLLNGGYDFAFLYAAGTSVAQGQTLTEFKPRAY